VGISKSAVSRALKKAMTTATGRPFSLEDGGCHGRCHRPLLGRRRRTDACRLEHDVVLRGVVAPKRDFAVLAAANLGGDDASQACDEAAWR